MCNRFGKKLLDDKFDKRFVERLRKRLCQRMGWKFSICLGNDSLAASESRRTPCFFEIPPTTKNLFKIEVNQTVIRKYITVLVSPSSDKIRILNIYFKILKLCQRKRNTIIIFFQNDLLNAT